MVTTTFTKTYSSIDIKPVELRLDGFDLKSQKIICRDFLTLNIYEFLKNAKDVAFGEKSLLILTDPKNYTDFAKSVDSNDYEYKTSDIDDLITTPISDIFDDLLIVNNNNNIERVPNLNADKIQFFKIRIVSSELLEILSDNDQIITHNFQTGNLTVSDQTQPKTKAQQFEYFENEKGFILFLPTTNKSKIVKFENNLLVVVDYNGESIGLNIEDYQISFFSYGHQEIVPQISDSKIVKYQNDLLNKNDFIVNTDDWKQNYLSYIPYDNILNSSGIFYIHPLKNYQTPEYKYSINNSHYDDNQWMRRVYNKIFIGNNQEKSYDSVYLNFTAKTKLLNIKPDEETLFFYPPSAQKMAVNDVGFIEDGAIAGEIPYISDRICIKQINYSDITPVNIIPTSYKKQDGTWACAWLSGSMNGPKQWMDRYYNSSYYTLDDALTATNKSLIFKDNNKSDFFWDEPSKIFLEPNLLYFYYRIGNNTIKSYIDNFSYNLTSAESDKLLDIQKWDTLELIDESVYANKGLVFTDSENKKTYNDYIELDGKTHVIFSTKNNSLPDYKFTANIWVNCDDWSNITGEQIFGNYFDGGFGLLNNENSNIPLFTICDIKQSIAYTQNYRFSIINTIFFNSAENSTFTKIQRLPDYSYWIFDTTNKVGYKYTINNDLVGFAVFSANLNQIDSVRFDSNQYIYGYCNTTKKVEKLSPSGDFISINTLPSTTKNIEIDLNNVLIPTYGEYCAIDSKNNIWECIGGNIYKNRNIHSYLGLCKGMVFDSDDNLWILHSTDSIAKLDTNINEFLFDIRVGLRSTISQNAIPQTDEINRFIGFIKTSTKSNCSPSDSISTVAVIVDNCENEIYLIDSNGNMISKLNLLSLSNFDSNIFASGDFTGYEYIRKYETVRNGVSWKLKISKPDGSDPQNINLTYDVSKLNGWHQFSLVFNAEDGYAHYYIDSSLVSSYEFAPQTYIMNYKYRSSLLIGASTVENKILNDLIEINDSYKFVGKVSNLKLYKKALSKGQIECLYIDSDYSESLSSLDWNFPIGERNYIEKIDKWFKMGVGGLKSKRFNINIHNLNVDPVIKELIEESINNSIRSITPIHTKLNNINWKQ